MNNISKRLKCIANQITMPRIADIGCDHGKVVEYLFENKQIDFALISDISSKSLQKAIDLLKENKRNFDFKNCNGIPSEFKLYNIEQIIISGMGGCEIVKILQKYQFQNELFTLSPQHNEIELKKYLIENGFEISKVIIVEDGGKFYTVINAKLGNQVLDDFELRYGLIDLQICKEDFKAYLKYLETKYKNIENITLGKSNLQNELIYIEMAKKELGE